MAWVNFVLLLGGEGGKEGREGDAPLVLKVSPSFDAQLVLVGRERWRRVGRSWEIEVGFLVGG